MVFGPPAFFFWGGKREIADGTFPVGRGFNYQKAVSRRRDNILDFCPKVVQFMDWYDILFIAAFLVIWVVLVTRVLPKYGGG